MERICLELADGEGVLPLERAGLLLIASNYRAAILDAQAGNRFADTVLTQGLFRRLAFSAKSLIGLGERAGARTQDPVIKRNMAKGFSGAISKKLSTRRAPLTGDNGRPERGFVDALM
ncbi:hypothetical protein ABIF78_011721 [Bradyrhizobium japonicum]